MSAGIGLQFTVIYSDLPVWVSAIAAVPLVIPSLAVLVRRLHDTGNSGWAFWWILVPFVGQFILLYLLVSPSNDGPNKYGPIPLPGVTRVAWTRVEIVTFTTVLAVGAAGAIGFLIFDTPQPIAGRSCLAMSAGEVAEITVGDDGVPFSPWKGSGTPEILDAQKIKTRGGQSLDEVRYLSVSSPGDQLDEVHIFALELTSEGAAQFVQGADPRTRNWWTWGDDTREGVAQLAAAAVDSAPACIEL